MVWMEGRFDVNFHPGVLDMAGSGFPPKDEYQSCHWIKRTGKGVYCAHKGRIRREEIKDRCYQIWQQTEARRREKRGASSC